jgi:single-strand DNA-binding protein
MINRIVLEGRLTRDPELRRSPADVAIASFTIACDNRQKNADGTKTTTFINCITFRQSADSVAKYTRKGSLVCVDGQLVQRNFDRKDGTKGTTFEILADRVEFLEPKGDSKTNDKTVSIQPEPVADDSKNLESIDIVDDDLPF